MNKFPPKPRKEPIDRVEFAKKIMQSFPKIMKALHESELEESNKTIEDVIKNNHDNN